MKNYRLTKEKYLNDKEFDHLNELLERYKDKQPRDCVLIWVAMYTGARANEVLAIKASDLDHQEKAVYIRGLKGSSDREIPLPDWLFAMLVKLEPDADGYMFPITYCRFQQIWCEFRPVKKGIHALRHTFAIRLYRKTLDIRLVQVALGHMAISNTMIYAAYHYEKTEMRQKILA